MYGSKWDLKSTTWSWKGLVHNLQATCFTILLHLTHQKSTFIWKLFLNLKFVLEARIFCGTKCSLPCANMFHCITLMGLLGALPPSPTWVNFLWKRGGLSLRASSHCRSSSTGSDTLCPCKTDMTLSISSPQEADYYTHFLYCEQRRWSHLTESWIQVYVCRREGVQMGWREGERRAAEGLSQGAVQPGGTSTHWTHCLEEKDGDRRQNKTLCI